MRNGQSEYQKGATVNDCRTRAPKLAFDAARWSFAFDGKDDDFELDERCCPSRSRHGGNTPRGGDAHKHDE